MDLLNVPAITETSGILSSGGYVMAALIALLILGYLLYTLFKPEKF